MRGPVGVLRAPGARVLGGDRRLDHVRARPGAPRLVGEREALGDLLGVPERAILVVEQNEPAARVGARFAPRVEEQHQRQQRDHLRLPGQHLAQHARQSDRLGAELRADEALGA